MAGSSSRVLLRDRTGRALRNSKPAGANPAGLVPLLGHEADNHILECVVEASADYLVTGDRRYLFPLERIMGVRIVNAPVFLNSLGE